MRKIDGSYVASLEKDGATAKLIIKVDQKEAENIKSWCKLPDTVESAHIPVAGQFCRISLPKTARSNPPNLVVGRHYEFKVKLSKYAFDGVFGYTLILAGYT
jgi:hypothetical protein